MISRLLTHYRSHAVPELKKQFGYANVHAVPHLEKVIVNVGVGHFLKDDKAVEKIRKNIEKITGQRALLRPAKKSIASFKIRKGMMIGIMVTLRGKRMYDFTDKLINVALPRIRDFRGLQEHSIDDHGNLSIGLREQHIFPEVSQEDLELAHGLQITLHSTARNYAEGLALFKLLGFPLTSEK